MFSKKNFFRIDYWQKGGIKSILEEISLNKNWNKVFENGNLIFDQLIIQNNGSNVQDNDAYATGSVNRKISIRSTTANKTYKILATT